MRLWQQLLEGLPGQMRHVPGGFGPGPAVRGPAADSAGGDPVRGRDGQGPMHVAPEGPFCAGCEYDVSALTRPPIFRPGVTTF